MRFKKFIRRLMKTDPKPLWFLITADLFGLVVALLLFALVHHVIPRGRASLGVVSSRDSMSVAAAVTAQPTEEAPADEADTDITEADTGSADADTGSADADTETDAEVTAAPTRVGDFTGKFDDVFSDGTIIRTDDTYQSDNVYVKITKTFEEGDSEHKGMTYYVADIYIRDISCFKTEFAKGTYGRNYQEDIVDASLHAQSVVMMSGDFYGIRDGGVCIRNGELYYNENVQRDICVLFWDGTVKCYTKEEFNAEEVMAEGAYQCWNFGPALLDGSGEPREYDSFYQDITENNPRAAFGYYEPGHYCFIVVEGRTDTSRGMTLGQLTKLAQKLGLKQCYNLDGGQTSSMTYFTDEVSEAAFGGRPCSDFLCIVDEIM